MSRHRDLDRGPHWGDEGLYPPDLLAGYWAEPGLGLHRVLVELHFVKSEGSFLVAGHREGQMTDLRRLGGEAA